ncbi:hypothetical protein PGTUg99_050232 [Puccinia graminis f. sp. tritici]|uniref:Reverse transcriptase Ty1/copia-type domain-containing protein n=1 Tax=Puccinia graminis f. sp. tritici TaxID=56615 RepID=A0A5B0LXZ0_PUCGR|nr:hypothetical protein PGTUg99_050232 [Puccinia graminis f. sp. tritici]
MFRLIPRSTAHLTALGKPRLRPLDWNFPITAIRANQFVSWSSTSRPSESEEAAKNELVEGDIAHSSCLPIATTDQDQRENNGSATTGRLVTLRTFLVHALKLHSPIVQLDLKAAFHHLVPSSQQDPSDQRPGDLCSNLDSSQKTPSPAAAAPKWTPTSRCKKLATWLEDHQLKQSKSDPCLYLGHRFHVFFLTDSILVIGDIESFKAQILGPRFSNMPNLHEVDTILGIQIRRKADSNSLYLSQPKQINKALSELKMLDEEGVGDVGTPLTPKLQLVEASDEEHEDFLQKGMNYRQSVGLLNHIASTTRPDVMYASSSLSQFTEKPGTSHWGELMRCWRYLKATEQKALELAIRPTGFDLEVWSDANWAGDPVSRKSHSGYLVCLHGSCISWNSARQSTVSLSSTESELRALVEATQELIWLQRLLVELNNTCPSPSNQKSTLSHMNYIDNNALACSLASASFHSKTKHIDVQTKWLREHVHTKLLSYQWIPTKSMLADCLTKPAPKAAYSLLCAKVSLN